MSTEVTKSQAALPVAINKVVAAGQRSISAASNLPTGDAFGEYSQEDGWTFGQDNIQVEEGSHWVVLVPSIKEGFISWNGVGAKPFVENRPWMEGGFPESELGPPGEKPWVPQWMWTAVCIRGEDAGQQVVFKSKGSGGYTQMAIHFTAEIGAKFLEIQDGAHPVEFCHPVIKMKDGNTYTNRQGKKISNPAVEIVAWADAEGNIYNEAGKIVAPKAEPEPEPEAEAKPTRRRRRKTA